MSSSPGMPKSTRRRFLQQTGSLAAGAAVLGGAVPAVHAGEDNTIRLALIGCGGRGSGAVRDALSVPDGGPVKLYAMADIMEDKLNAAQRALAKTLGDKVDVAEDRKFVGFDAYRKAIDILRPGDIAMCTTRAYIRPTHVEYAVKKGINVFMEKPFASDPGSLHRLLRAGEEAQRKNVKIAAGLQCRHSPARSNRCRLPGSDANGFSMKTLIPFFTAYSTWVGRMYARVVHIAMSPGRRTSIALR